MNSQQNKQLNGLLTATGNTANKASLVLGITKGRSESRADLTDAEAADLINWLNKQPKPQQKQIAYGAAELQRRKLIAIAHKMGWKLESGKVDLKRLNEWCLKQFGKKGLNDYTEKELPKLVTIFDKVYEQFLNSL